jgi:hypothetical protein
MNKPPPLRIAHPLADLLPLMNSLDFEELVGDISKNGQLEKITIDEHGQIMDGRNRCAACDRLGIEPQFETWQGKPGTEADFIFAKNLVRRHLNEVQKAEIAEKLATAKRGGRAPGPNLWIQRLTQPQAAKATGTTVTNISLVRVLKDAKRDDLLKLAREGKISLTRAAEIAKREGPKATEPAPAKPKKSAKLEQRDEEARRRGQQWKRLEQALDSLSGFPRAADVALSIPASQNAKVSQRLDKIINWLTVLKETLDVRRIDGSDSSDRLTSGHTRPL